MSAPSPISQDPSGLGVIPDPGERLPAGGRRIDAPAKVNLFLELLRKRADGYHDLETLILHTELADTLEIEPTVDGRIQIHCEEPGIPTGPANLVWKAAEALRTRFGIASGATIRLTKRIPHEAGLGGGSSDAASTLAALNTIWALNKSVAELLPVAAVIGSDVAAFLLPPACWCTGRGEVVEAVPVAETPLHLVIVKPPVGLSTAEVYRNCRLPERPVNSVAVRIALAVGSIRALGAGLHNRLQDAAFALQPLVKTVYDALTATNPAGVLVSGSGSCVFALAHDEADALRIAANVQQPDCRVILTRSRGTTTPRPVSG